jgi:hypothetical protein
MGGGVAVMKKLVFTRDACIYLLSLVQAFLLSEQYTVEVESMLMTNHHACDVFAHLCHKGSSENRRNIV